MKSLIISDKDKCEGCNQCIRNCPVEEANIAYFENGKTKVTIDNSKCIACGACIIACEHGARDYVDDTESFINDLEAGKKISLLIAPANRTNNENGKRIITWLKNKGVNKVFDVSLGADICTWAHIRAIENNEVKTLITQPCPAIVNYICKHKKELVDKLSPIHSPMLCTAVFLRKYAKVEDDIAVISPCIAKSNEFEETNIVKYNVTFKRINEYIQKNMVDLPMEETDFDHFDAGLGRIYSMPGGLKENIEFYFGHKVRVDKSEGGETVYKALNEYALADENDLPAVFDVLNCKEGCNIGTGCNHDVSLFIINRKMNDEKNYALDSYDLNECKRMYAYFDNNLEIKDFFREYEKNNVSEIYYTEDDLENAFINLKKDTQLKRMHNCFSCGSETCKEMAIKIAKKINVPENCIEKTRADVIEEHHAYINEQKKSLEHIANMMQEVLEIKGYSDEVKGKIECINSSLNEFSEMSQTISKISLQTNLISLNASIEAARVGKLGKAFDVVASEIRTLARNASESVLTNSESQERAFNSLKQVDDLIINMANLVEKTYNNISYLYESTKEQ